MSSKVSKKVLCIILSLLSVGIVSFFIFFSGNKSKNNENKIFKIGILQFAEHESLDACREGFVQGLNKLGLKDGEQIEIDYKNAQGDQSNCATMANKFISENKDLIFAIATPAALTVAKATNEIPILISAVTNPAGVGLVESNAKPETNISGTTDLSPINKQMGLVKDLLPTSKNVAILYSSGEPNSKYQSDIASEEAKKINLNPRVYTFSHFNELQTLIQQMKGKVDAIYTPTDNQVASNLEVVLETAKKCGLPVITWDEKSVAKGGIGTYGIDYFELGSITGRKAYEILVEKKNIKEMPIENLQNVKLFLNKKMMQEFKISIPDKFEGKYELVS